MDPPTFIANPPNLQSPAVALKGLAWRENDIESRNHSGYTITVSDPASLPRLRAYISDHLRLQFAGIDTACDRFIAQIDAWITSTLPAVAQPLCLSRSSAGKRSAAATTSNPTFDIPLDVNSGYLMFLVQPGAGNPLYTGRDAEWTLKGYKGCTGELKACAAMKEALAEQGICTRVISTMTFGDEQAARANRPFKTPNTLMFAVLSDLRGAYEQYGCEPRVAIDSGEKVYEPHIVLLRKSGYDRAQGTWTGEKIAVWRRKDHSNADTLIATVLDMVKADRLARLDAPGPSKRARATVA